MKSGPIRILLVEDNHADARLTTLVLLDGRIPKQVSIVEDGVGAIETLERGPLPDLVLLDLNLPKQGGQEVLGIVKSRWPDIPVLILSGSSAERDISAAYQAGANCYLTKPADLDQYVEMVRSVENFWVQRIGARGIR